MAASNEVLVQTINELEARTGNNRTLAEALADEVRDPAHPLHDDPEFYWDDDAAAAYQHRLAHCKKLIKQAKLIAVNQITRREMRIPAFIRDPFGRPGSFIPTPRLQTERDLAVEGLRQEFQRCHGPLQRALNVASTIPNVQELVNIERERIIALLRRFETP